MKRFVPPLLKKPSSVSETEVPPPKRSRTDDTSPAEAKTTPFKPVRLPSGGIPLPSARRKPLLTVKNPVSSSSSSTQTADLKTESSSSDRHYNVLWRKITTKKHKTFDGDGVLTISAGYANLQDTSGASLGRTMCSTLPSLGDIIKVSNKEVEIDSELSHADYMAGRPFLKAAGAAVAETAPAPPPPPVSAVAVKGFKTPLLGGSTGLKKKDPKVPTPRHDPSSEGALVMPRPTIKPPSGKQWVDVVVDPYISQHLRPHQREGVEFMYTCVMNQRGFDGRGCILADEMGLGKTLQTIALIWTLLKQNPVYNDPPVVKKALIVCPVTLINNWKKEFRKWLGNERIGVMIIDGKNGNVADFLRSGRTYAVGIIGYEKLQRVQDELRKGTIDIVVADEGHRLKTDKNKAAAAIQGLNTPRKIILSGTPLQNDLHEFFTMVDFVNPGLLENYATFRREFENPIVKSRQPNASPKDIEKGKARSEMLSEITSKFILRRTAEILSSYLPPKKEYVLFCRPTSRQLEVYRNILESSQFQRVLGDMGSSLQLITILKKLCNTPGLLNPSAAGRDPDLPDPSPGVRGLLETVHPKNLESTSPSSSGKLRVLDRLVRTLSETTDEKIVIVSNYTSTLDILGNLLHARSLPFLRLDGSTPTDKRQQLVDRFNRTTQQECFAFLLSAKSGGAGINLIGASRLLLFDLDWNPATDLQAMARIHRDGQKRPVYIYRLLTTGCFDEKIFQRQITKMGLAESIVDKKSGSAAFTMAELRDLFRLDDETECQTHDLLGCPCEGKGYLGDEEREAMGRMVGEEEDRQMGLRPASQVTEEMIIGKKGVGKEGLGALMGYEHVRTGRLKTWEALGDDEGDVTLEDELLMRVLTEKGRAREVGFVFQKCF